MANSTQTAVSDGNLELVTLSFSYLDRSEISVFFDSVPTSAWEWVGVSGPIIKFTPKVPNGVTVLIKRTTDQSALRHQYSLGAKFDAPTLDESLAQVLHIVQEASEANLSSEFYGDVNLHGSRLLGVAAGVSPTDGANVGQVAGIVSPYASAASASATAAASSAAAAASSAANSATSASASLLYASTALEVLEGAVQSDGSVAMTAPLEVVPAVAGNHSVPLSQVNSLIAAAVASAVLLACPVGTISAQARLANAPGWLLVDGKTIGNASSGATSRANADTWPLFEQLWSFPAASVPIYTSAGAASTRGLTAAEDFAAGKRLPLFTPDGGAFLRMWTPGQTKDAGRAAGSEQLDALQGHEHSAYVCALTHTLDGGGLGLPTGNHAGATYGIIDKPGYGTARVATETRGYNLAIPHYIFLGVAT